jgi:hypothetical protein
VFAGNTINEEAFQFSRLYPNPANEMTCVEFSVRASQRVNAYILDAQGRRAQEIYSGILSPEQSKLFFDASALAEGMYFVQVIGERGVYRTPFVVK